MEEPGDVALFAVPNLSVRCALEVFWWFFIGSSPGIFGILINVGVPRPGIGVRKDSINGFFPGICSGMVDDRMAPAAAGSQAFGADT
jgi:hypothetical protein